MLTTAGPRPLRTWCWVQFSAGFLVGGVASFLSIDGWSSSLTYHVVRTLAVACLCGIIAGRFGDPAWFWFVRTLRWLM